MFGLRTPFILIIIATAIIAAVGSFMVFQSSQPLPDTSPVPETPDASGTLQQPTSTPELAQSSPEATSDTGSLDPIEVGEEPIEPAPPEAPETPPLLPPTKVNETNMPLAFPNGFRISLFTNQNLGPIRFMAFSPDGILFVSLPSASGLYKGKGGGKVFALPDRDQDGKADEVKTVLAGLNDRPHGLAFYNGYLYVAEETRISRYPYQGDGNVGAREIIVDGLPSGGEHSHVSRTIGFSSSGKMYVSVGSSCNICEEADARRAAILEYNAEGSGERIFARGLRNSVGFVFHPSTGEIWATDNGRDWLGDNLPPDEINIVREGGHYGWPYCYGNNVVDPEFNNAMFCATAEESTHTMQAHSAPLGLRFIEGPQFPQDWQGDLLVAYHGSWNRTEPTGYKVVRLDVSGNTIVGESDFISGWLLSNGSKLGRPVDLIFDSNGALYISDDKANVIYRVTRL